MGAAHRTGPASLNLGGSATPQDKQRSIRPGQQLRWPAQTRAQLRWALPVAQLRWALASGEEPNKEPLATIAQLRWALVPYSLSVCAQAWAVWLRHTGHYVTSLATRSKLRASAVRSYRPAALVLRTSALRDPLRDHPRAALLASLVT